MTGSLKVTPLWILAEKNMVVRPLGVDLEEGPTVLGVSYLNSTPGLGLGAHFRTLFATLGLKGPNEGPSLLESLATTGGSPGQGGCSLFCLQLDASCLQLSFCASSCFWELSYLQLELSFTVKQNSFPWVRVGLKWPFSRLAHQSGKGFN